MALLGAQLVITLIVVTIIQKVGPHFSLARWLLCSTGLVRYLYPTNAELRQLANIPKDKAKAKRNGKNQSAVENDTFFVPRSLDVQLEATKVTQFDVIHLRYFTEYQWLVDFASYTTVVYIITEVYQVFFPLKNEVNLSMLWCSLVLLFSIKSLMSLTLQYFKGEESIGERSTCIIMGFVYLLVAMIALIIDENILELGLESAYSSFNQSANMLFTSQGVVPSGPASKIVLKFFAALWCGILGALLTFPGLRIARMHWDLLRCYRENKIIQILLNLEFALPFILVVLWIKPVSRDYLTVRIFSGFTQPILTEDAFDSLRIILIIFAMCLKLVVMPWYLQAYLNLAYNKTEEQKKEAGRISNVDLQRKIAAVFYYLCVVTLQYVVPLVMCLTLAIMYKTLGGYTWSGLFVTIPKDECSLNEEVESKVLDPFYSSSSGSDGPVSPTVEYQIFMENLKAVFTTEVFRGVLGFLTWWCCFAYFAAASIGLVYQSYFSLS